MAPSSFLRMSAALLLCGGLAGGQVSENLDGALDALAAQHADLARVETIETTLRGRPVRALVVAAGELPLAERRGMLLVAGLDGRRLVDGELLLEAVRRLLDREDLADRLGELALVVVPRANPDGAAALLGEVGPLREIAGNRHPDDADRDGRTDEDGPTDLDGDGRVTWMRIPDGGGTWTDDEDDVRALRAPKASEGERAEWKVVREGEDVDLDGEIAEDGDEGVWPTRNFPHGWESGDAAAGGYPLSEPESRGLADLLLQNPGLLAVLVVGEEDTLVSTPPAAKRVERGRFMPFSEPLDGLLEDDVETFAEWTRRLEEAAGEEPHEVEGDGPQDGSLLAWAYHQAGRWPLGFRAWAPPTDFPEDAADEGDDAAGEEQDDADGEGAEGDTAADAGDADADDEEEPERTSDPDSPAPAAVLAWIDAERGGEGFVPWAEFDHPELGFVEIGGLAPGTLFNPPLDDVLPLADTLADFTLNALAAFPRAGFEDLEITNHGGGIYAISVDVVNDGVLPTAPAFAAEARLARPLRVRLLLPPGVERVNGPAQELIDRLPGGGGRHALRWVLAGAERGARITIALDADTVPDEQLEVFLP